MKRTSLAVLCLALSVASSLSAQAVFVDIDATGANNGSSWADAYVNLQDALAATTTGQIWIAEGRYRPAPVGQASVSFQLKNQVALYGGFAGTESSLAQRNVQLYDTVLDGDLAGDDLYGAGANWWQYAWVGRFENSGRVVDGSGVDASAILDGVTVAAGFGTSAPINFQGAGLYILNGSPTVRNCTFRYNSFGQGSSIYIDGGAPTFEDCVIKDAYTIGLTASGVFLLAGSVSFTDCTFENHYTVTTMGNNDGSAFFSAIGTFSTFLRCSFVNNSIGNLFAMGDPSGSYGAAILNAGSLTVDSCSFTGGFGNGGSAIATYGSMVVRNSLFYDNFARPYPVASYFDDGDTGAAIFVFPSYGGGRTLTVDSCTFVDNYCDKGAGIYSSGPEDVIVRNSVLYFNDGPTAMPGEDIVPPLLRQFAGKVSLENCNVQELWVKFPNEDPLEANKYPGSFDQNPRFVDWQNGNLAFRVDSPCLNSGNTNLLPPGLTTDLSGAPRVQGSEVDLGCYESSQTAVPSLVATSMITEIQATISVLNAQPGESVYFIYSFTGLGLGQPVPQLGGLQLGILGPTTLLQGVIANTSGHAILNILIPPTAPAVDVFLQAAIVRGAGGNMSVLTNTVSQRIYLKP